MKPLHHLLIISIRNSLIVIVAFTLYERIETLKEEWGTKSPHNKNLHVHIGRLYHLISIFIAEFVIGFIVYCMFNIMY
jgi:hypothetical protein